jgi:probable rRNA maturation factor
MMTMTDSRRIPIRMHMLNLDLQHASTRKTPAPAELTAWVRAALSTGTPDVTNASELTIRVVDEEESAALNQQYRSRPGPTNVLSFPFETPPGAPPTGLLGDLVICAPVVEREAGEQGKSIQAHWAHMVVHGTLHLLGHDHQQEAEATAMEALESDILTHLGFAPPY